LTQALDEYNGGAQIAKLLAADGAANDYFGNSLAVDGDTMVIGAYGDGNKSGSAYIFTRDDAGSLTASWTQRAKLLASDGAGGDNFGFSVAISCDTVVVGAYHDDDKGSNSGSAYIFTRDDAGSLTASWTQRAKLLASDGMGDDYFGVGVAIGGDTVVVGAIGDDDNGSGSGSAYIFTCDDAGSLTASWTQRAKLLASDGAESDIFGLVVAISGDTVVVGAYLVDLDTHRYTNHGSAYIFTRDNAGSLTASWTQRAKLLASDGAGGAFFGVSVAISGNIVVVGAPYSGFSYYYDGNGFFSGSAYIFTSDDTGSLTSSWTQRAKLLAADGSTDDNFGHSVAISGDTVVVGAYYSANNRGSIDVSAYIFTRDEDAGSLTANWTQRAKLLASDGEESDYNYWGRSVAVDGNTVVAGAYNDCGKGSASVFTTASVEFVAIEASMGGARTRMYNHLLMGCQQLIGIV
jgi:uncharacterized protein YfcZ (UPF0381/DUF406 family)